MSFFVVQKRLKTDFEDDTVVEYLAGYSFSLSTISSPLFPFKFSDPENSKCALKSSQNGIE